jgi:hypothetical protein
VGVAHRCQEPSFETVKRLSLLLIEVVSPKEPLLGLRRGLFAMAVDLDIECAVRDEVGDNDFGRAFWRAGVEGRGDGWVRNRGSGCDRHVGKELV